MELDAAEPGMAVVSDDHRQDAVGRHAAETHAALLEPALVVGVDLVAVAVALRDFARPIDVGDAGAALEQRRIGAEPHGAAEIAIPRASLQLVALEPLGHQADHRLARRAELARVRLLDAAEIARRLDHGHLHAEADAEIRHRALPPEFRRADLPLPPPLAHPPAHHTPLHLSAT